MMLRCSVLAVAEVLLLVKLEQVLLKGLFDVLRTDVCDEGVDRRRYRKYQQLRAATSLCLYLPFAGTLRLAGEVESRLL